MTSFYDLTHDLITSLLKAKTIGGKYLSRKQVSDSKTGKMKWVYKYKRTSKKEKSQAAGSSNKQGSIPEKEPVKSDRTEKLKEKTKQVISKKPETQAAQSESKPSVSAQDDYRTNGVKAKAFKDWFGDWEQAKQTGNYDGVSKVVDKETGKPKEMSSKITDDEGNPIAVFHGSSAMFDEFKLSEFGKTDQGWYGKGFYFTEAKEEAEGYARVQNMNENTLNQKVDNTIKLNEDWLKSDYSSFSSKKPETLREKIEYVKYLESRKLNDLKAKSSPEGYTEWENYSKSRVSSYVNALAILEGTLKKDDFIKTVYLNIKNPLYLDGTGDQNSKEHNKKIIQQLGDKELMEFSEKETSGIFEKFGAEKFTNLLKSKGYDGVIVFADGLYKRKFHEVVAFEPNQIKHVDNDGTFDPKQNNMYKARVEKILKARKKVLM